MFGMSSAHTPKHTAWVLGASEGLGAAFAWELAERDYGVLLVARRGEVLKRLAAEIDARHGARTQVLALDLSTSDAPAQLAAIGVPDLVVYNAAMVPKGAFATTSPDALRNLVEVNVATPLLLLNNIVGPMIERGSGDIVLMSSLAGHQGAPGIAGYAASKAFNSILAEGLWHELGQNTVVRIVACDAGAISTPGLAALDLPDAPGTMTPKAVARAALDGLNRGPKVIPGWINKVGNIVLGRLLPKRWSIAIMAKNTASLLLEEDKNSAPPSEEKGHH